MYGFGAYAELVYAGLRDAVVSAATVVTGGIIKRRKKLTKEKHYAHEMAERYNRLIRDAGIYAEQQVAPVIQKYVTPKYRETTAEDIFVLPTAAQVDFEKIAQEAQTRVAFLKAMRRAEAMRDEEEEFIIRLLASL